MQTKLFLFFKIFTVFFMVPCMISPVSQTLINDTYLQNCIPLNTSLKMKFLNFMSLSYFYLIQQMREKAHLEAQMLAWKEQEEEDKKLKEESLREKYALRLAQQEQIVQNQQVKIESYRRFVQEKLMLDAVVQEMVEEDRR